jgi:hypothetical protein
MKSLTILSSEEVLKLNLSKLIKISSEISKDFDVPKIDNYFVFMALEQNIDILEYPVSKQGCYVFYRIKS